MSVIEYTNVVFIVDLMWNWK